MKKKYLLLIVLTGIFNCLNAQQNNINYSVEIQAGYNGPGAVPFWLRSNKYGSVPPEGASLALIGAVRKKYNPSKARIADWSFSIEGRANLGNPSDIILIEGYGKVRFAMFELLAGRSKDITGLCDTSLTSGSYAVSGNALGIPKIQFSIPEFYTLTCFGKMFAFKGNFVHGWMGRTYKYADTGVISETYLHQLSLYGRFGKPEWKLKLYGGFNHQVVWGDENTFMGEDYMLTGAETYYYIITGKYYNNKSIQEIRVGNHLGSIDLGLEYEFRNIKLFLYRQNLYEAGAIYHFANILDGLNGMSITNNNTKSKGFQWSHILVEFLYTKNQAGEVWSKKTTSPIENYFNNGFYTDGWSYKGQGLGTPFITTDNLIKESLPTSPGQVFVNNRVIAFHFGIAGSLKNWNFTSKLSYSLNYGNYYTAAEGKEFPGFTYPSPYGVFPKTGQFSGYFKTSKTLQNDMIFSFLTALDVGDLYDNTFGLICSLSKTF